MPATTRRSSAAAKSALPLEAVIPLAEALARREAHRPDDVEDMTQVGLHAYFRATVRKKVVVLNPRAFACTILRRAMRGYYWQQREWQTRGEPNKDVGLDQVALGKHSFGAMPMVELDGRPFDGEQVELLEFDDYFNALERACGPTARLMVENLLMPSGECCARILEEVREKQTAQQECGAAGKAVRRHQPRGVKKEIRISHRLVRDALGLSPSEWVRHMERIREFTAAWIGR